MVNFQATIKAIMRHVEPRHAKYMKSATLSLMPVFIVSMLPVIIEVSSPVEVESKKPMSCRRTDS